MWPDGIVMASPTFDQHLGLIQRCEDLRIQQLVAQLRIEALIVAVFPRTSRFDKEGLHAEAAEPSPHLFGGKFAAIVGPYVFLWTMDCKEFS